VKDRSLQARDFAANQLPAGERGPQGDRGAQGERGPQGEQGIQGTAGQPGADGSPDTPAGVLAKLSGVDGAGSGLDADRLDGQSSVDFVRRSTLEIGNVAGYDNAIQSQLSEATGIFEVIDDGDVDTQKTVKVRNERAGGGQAIRVTPSGGTTTVVNANSTSAEFPAPAADPDHLVLRITDAGDSSRSAWVHCAFDDISHIVQCYTVNGF
jgi:hypothetical protein